MLVLLVGTGVFLTFYLGGVQFRLLGHSLYLAFVKRHEEGAEGDISHSQALMTALAATVGTGLPGSPRQSPPEAQGPCSGCG